MFGGACAAVGWLREGSSPKVKGQSQAVQYLADFWNAAYAVEEFDCRNGVVRSAVR
jgi:hypothetical protein